MLGDDLIRSFKHLLDPETYELAESVLSKDEYYTIQTLERDVQRYFSAIGHIDAEQLKKHFYTREQKDDEDYASFYADLCSWA